MTRRRALTLAGAVASAAAGVALVVLGLQPQGPPRAPQGPAPLPPGILSPGLSPGAGLAGATPRVVEWVDAVPARAGRFSTTAASAPVSVKVAVVPVELDAPSIRLHTALRPVGLAADGGIMVPSAGPGAPAGWYRSMATPGDRGVAVLVGHVDSARDGPAVFYHLAELKPGDPVSVLRSDGRRARFVVAAVREYPKTNFPAGQVYADVDRPELRLITCGGDFDQAMGSYRDSIVVYAVGRTPPA